MQALPLCTKQETEPLAHGEEKSLLSGERWERHQWQIQRPERVAAVEKIEDPRKPDDFFGHRNMRPMYCHSVRKCPWDTCSHKKPPTFVGGFSVGIIDLSG